MASSVSSVSLWYCVCLCCLCIFRFITFFFVSWFIVFWYIFIRFDFIVVFFIVITRFYYFFISLLYFSFTYHIYAIYHFFIFHLSLFSSLLFFLIPLHLHISPPLCFNSLPLCTIRFQSLEFLIMLLHLLFTSHEKPNVFFRFHTFLPFIRNGK